MCELYRLIQGCQTQGPRAYSSPPHTQEHMIVLQKKKKIMKCAYQYHKFLFLFGVLFIHRNWLWCAYDTQCFFHWWRLRGRLKGIKRTSSSARAPPTEKHDILHSFNELKNRWKLSDTTFFSFFWGVILMTNVQNTLHPARVHQIRERKSFRWQVDSHSFTLTENGRALYLSDITCVRSKMIFSPEFNVAISVGMH